MKKAFEEPTLNLMQIFSETIAENGQTPTTSMGLEDFSDPNWH